MRIGIVADVHEEVERLQHAIRVLRGEGMDALVFLGDLVQMAKRLEECVESLSEAGAVGVIGNHELGLCVEPDPELLSHYSPKVGAFMQTLGPSLVLDECWFGHIEPYLDVTNPEDYYSDGGGPLASAETVRQSFQARPERVVFVGHYHAWRVVTTRHVFDPLHDTESLWLKPPERYVVMVHALMSGWLAMYDTESAELRRYRA